MLPRALATATTLVLLIGAFSPVPVPAGGGPLLAGSDSPASDSALVCPSHSNPKRIRLWIQVTKWCGLPAVRGQAQFKLQMRIHNRHSDRSLDVSQDRIRLIVRNFDPDRWSPPRIGVRTTDRPIRTTYGGEQVWAVPANADGAYDMIRRGEATFATHWGASHLGPRETLNPGFHYGDLVFYVPSPQRGPGGIANVAGVAYVDGHEIIALCRPENWGPKVRAASF
jgi:hypothetical protein